MSIWEIGPAFEACSLLEANSYNWQTAAQVAAAFGSPPPIGLEAKNAGNFTNCNCDWVMGTTIQTGGSTGPTWSSGIGAPTSDCINSSMYSREDGTTGTRLYVSHGGGVWVAMW
jgi:hypothetical protein